MKKTLLIVCIGILLSGMSFAENANLPKNKKSNKHDSFKKAKKKRSRYFFSFQH